MAAARRGLGGDGSRRERLAVGRGRRVAPRRRGARRRAVRRRVDAEEVDDRPHLDDVLRLQLLDTHEVEDVVVQRGEASPNLFGGLHAPD